MDDPSLVPWMQLKDDVINSPKHQQLAIKMARESMTLLQNKDNILPLKKTMKVAVMGPNATDSVTMWANYNGFPYHTTTILEGIKNKIGAENVIYTQGCTFTQNVVLNSFFDQCALNGKQGFQATYWNNTTFNGEPATTDWLTTPFNFSAAGGTVFARGVSLTNFSARYESVFTPKESGDVAFHMNLNGGYTLYIDGEEQNKGGSIGLPTKVYMLHAEAGKSYTIRLDYSVRYEGSLNFDLGKEETINFSKEIERVKDADVVIFAGGISPKLEGEEMAVNTDGFKGGDRTNIELPAVQRELLKQLHAAGKQVVFVNCSGSAMGLVPETESCRAILQAGIRDNQPVLPWPTSCSAIKTGRTITHYLYRR